MALKSRLAELSQDRDSLRSVSESDRESRIREVLAQNPQGMNGKELAAAVGVSAADVTPAPSLAPEAHGARIAAQAAHGGSGGEGGSE